MAPKASPAATAFAKTLRSLETGGLTYSDVLAEIEVLLETGASPTELRDILRGRELIEPLPQRAHVEMFGLLNDAIALEKEQAAASAEAQNAQADTTPDQLQDRIPAPTSIPGPTLVDKSSRNTAVGQSIPLSAVPTLSPFSGARGPQLVTTQSVSSKFEATAAARATALAADLAAARLALESERSKTREVAKTLADKNASVEAARVRTEDALRESERSQTEARTLRDLLAARDAELAALTQEHAKQVQALESGAAGGTQLETDLRATRANESTLTVNLATARMALESEQSRNQERHKALADRVASTEKALALAEEALRKSERRQTDAQALRDSLAARDAQLAALIREHATAAAALEAHSKRGTQLEADLQAARGRISTVSAELKVSQEAAAALNARFNRSESLLTAARTELEAVKAQSKAHLESLRTRDKGRGELHTELEAADAFVDSMRTHSSAEAQRAAESQSATAKSAQSRAQQAAPMAERQPTPTATVEPVPAARTARLGADKGKSEKPEKPDQSEQEVLAAAARSSARKPRASARAIGLSAAALLAVVAAWFFAHHTSAPIKMAASVASLAAAQSPGTVIHDCPTCPTMTVLPTGRFKQGSPRAGGETPPVETPQHWVSIGRSFAMSTNLITVDEFGQFIAATGRDMQGCDTYEGTWKHQTDKSWKDPGFVQTGTHPVTCVSSQDAEAYAQWLSSKTGYRYRLPSASEWEYAARAGGEAAQPWGSNAAAACANANVADQSAARRYPGWQVFACDDGYVYTSPVGSFKTNWFGLNDMLGNVFQWTEDCWHADYSGAPINGSARTDGNCAVRELRGGSWFTSPVYVRTSYRNHFAADYRTSTVGIRLVRELVR